MIYFRYFKLAADQSDRDAQFHVPMLVGKYYARGMGVGMNKVLAVKYFMMTAEQGHKDVIRRIAICYIY